MPTASLTLDLLALLLATGVVAVRIVRYRRLRVDHVVLFCVGHAYYLSLSSLMIATGAMPDTYSFVYTYFQDVTDQRRLAASAWSLLVLVAFLSGAWLGAGARRSRAVRQDKTAAVSPRTFVAPAMALTAAMLTIFTAVAAQNRALVISGYRSLDASDVQGQGGRGLLSAVASATILSALFMLHVAATSGRRSVAPGVKWLAGVAIALPSIILLLAGGRLYAATCLVAVIVWYSHVRQPISRSIIIGAGLAAFVALTALGSVRTGSLPDAETVGFYATSESVLTSITQGRFLSSDREVLQPLRLPKYLASDVSNAVPRLLLPGKEALRLDPEDDGFQVTSPLGSDAHPGLELHQLRAGRQRCRLCHTRLLAVAPEAVRARPDPDDLERHVCRALRLAGLLDVPRPVQHQRRSMDVGERHRPARAVLPHRSRRPPENGVSSTPASLTASHSRATASSRTRSCSINVRRFATSVV